MSTGNSSELMTASERAELAQLVRRREAVTKTAAKAHAAELLAQAEADLAATFAADDARWAGEEVIPWARIDQISVRAAE